MFTTTPARAGEIIRPTDQHARGMVRGELARTHALLGDLDPADWLRLTDCTGWRVRDVVAHIIGGNEELPRPARLIRRVRMARRLAGPDDGDGAARDRSVTVPGAPASSADSRTGVLGPQGDLSRGAYSRAAAPHARERFLRGGTRCGHGWAQLPAPIERYRRDVSLQGCASHHTGRDWAQAMRLA